LDERTLTILETRDYLYREYACPTAQPVDFCVIFSEDNRKGTHPPDLCLEAARRDHGQGAMSQSKGRWPRRRALPRADRPGRAGTYYFLYTYKCGREYTQSFLRQQYTIFANGLLHPQCQRGVDPCLDSRERRSARRPRAATQFMASAIPCLR